MKKKLLLSTAVLGMTIAVAEPIAITDVEAQYSANTKVEASKELKQSINFGLANTTGNTETLNINGKYNMSFSTVGYRDEALNVMFDTSAYVTENNGVRDNEEYTVNLGIEQYILDGWLGYSAANWFRNTFQNYDNRVSFGIGAGKDLFNDGKQLFKLKLGAAYNYQDFTDNQITRKFASFNQYLEYSNQMNEVSKLYVKVGAMENLEDFSNDYEVTAVIGFTFAVAESISVSIEEEIRYDNFPAEGFNSTDTKSIIRVGYNF